MRDPAAPAGSSSIKECFFKMMMTEPALEDRHCATFRQGQGDSTSVRGLNMRDRENVPRRALCIWSELKLGHGPGVWNVAKKFKPLTNNLPSDEG